MTIVFDEAPREELTEPEQEQPSTNAEPFPDGGNGPYDPYGGFDPWSYIFPYGYSYR